MTAPPVPLFPPRILACLKEPGKTDAAGMEWIPEGLRGLDSGRLYACERGVPALTGLPADESPLPGSPGLEEFGELVNRGSRDHFLAALLRAIGFNRLILECGSGNGERSHFLQLNNNHVLGVDTNLAGLALAVEYGRRNQLARACFARMDPLDLAIKDASLDVVLVNGARLGGFDPERVFSHVATKLKPGGVAVLSLGRSPGEVLGWLERENFEYLNCRPPILGTDGEEETEMFAKTAPGTPYQRLVTRAAWLIRGQTSFHMIGRRKG